MSILKERLLKEDYKGKILVIKGCINSGKNEYVKNILIEQKNTNRQTIYFDFNKIKDHDLQYPFELYYSVAKKIDYSKDKHLVVLDCSNLTENIDLESILENCRFTLSMMSKCLLKTKKFDIVIIASDENIISETINRCPTEQYYMINFKNNDVSFKKIDDILQIIINKYDNNNIYKIHDYFYNLMPLISKTISNNYIFKNNNISITRDLLIKFNEYLCIYYLIKKQYKIDLSKKKQNLTYYKIYCLNYGLLLHLFKEKIINKEYYIKNYIYLILIANNIDSNYLEYVTYKKENSVTKKIKHYIDFTFTYNNEKYAINFYKNGNSINDLKLLYSYKKFLICDEHFVEMNDINVIKFTDIFKKYK